MRLIIRKQNRCLLLLDGDTPVHRCAVALGFQPVGAKRAQGDGRTPEGTYHICLVKPKGKFGRSLGLDYPNLQDAQRAFEEGRIDISTLQAVQSAMEENRRPPWGSPLGGEIYIHEGGSAGDWTAGCIALDEKDMDIVFPLWERITQIDIER